MNNNKDIYELINEIEFDINDIDEIKVDELSQKRIKNKVMNKTKKKFNKKNKIIASTVAAVALIIAGVSPVGQDVIAEIKEKLFFIPGIGISKNSEDDKGLNSFVNFTIDGTEMLLKKVSNRNGELIIEIWFDNNTAGDIELSNEKIKDAEEIRNKTEKLMKIKVDNGEIKKAVGIGLGISVDNRNYMRAIFDVDKNMKCFNLIVEDKDLGRVDISNKEDINLIDSNKKAEDKGFLIGAELYEYNSKKYLSFWNKGDFDSSKDLRIHYPEFKITDASGKEINYENSDTSRGVNEFVIEDDFLSPLKVEVSKLYIDYPLEKKIDIPISIPKIGEIIELNKPIDISEIGEKVVLKTITRNGNNVELDFDINSYKNKDSEIYGFKYGYRPFFFERNELDEKTTKIIIPLYSIELEENNKDSFIFEIDRVSFDKIGRWNLQL